MFSQIPERAMHRLRWVLTGGWLLLIASLFYDPISPLLTRPEASWSPLRLRPEECIAVQQQCLDLEPYTLGPPIFWGAIVPSAILILLVFGHELWRRICPLSFLSQLPRALGIQRQIARTDGKSGKVRYEIPRVRSDSWLGKYAPYLQFGLLFVGLCSRILFINGDRWLLGGWLLGTIAAAITVGYLYGGKTWCNYFCPMAPVQQVYAEPGALLASKAHTSASPLTQSMCRVVTPEGKEQSACVACQNPCIDIDAERSYWSAIAAPERQFLYYSYVGLVLGYFFYYYLYAGNWDYYFSGAWAMEPNAAAKLWGPGFYLYGRAIAIPKLVAVPLTLTVFTAGGYAVGLLLERAYAAAVKRLPRPLTPTQIRHHLFSLCTFVAFNFFFLFGGRPFLTLLPVFWQDVWDVAIVLLSTLWLAKTWGRTPDLYQREGVAGRFRKQLAKLDLNLAQYLDGRSLDDLNPHEVYVLAKVLPGFTKEKRQAAYKGVLRDALAEGYVSSANSLAVLRQMREELDIHPDEHRQILLELGVEQPELLDPDRQRNVENLVRLSGYRKALERFLSLQRIPPADTDRDRQQLRSRYAITPAEESAILRGLDPQANTRDRAEFLLRQLREEVATYRALSQPSLRLYCHPLALLQTTLRQRKRAIATGLLDCLQVLGDTTEAVDLATRLGELAPAVLPDLLEAWRDRLADEVRTKLTQPQPAVACTLDLPAAEIVDRLAALLPAAPPLPLAAGLYVLSHLDRDRALAVAADLPLTVPPVVDDVLRSLLAGAAIGPLAEFPRLERLVYLGNSDFFGNLHDDTLLALGDRAEIRTYEAKATITEAGDTCRELLLLVEGIVEVTVPTSQGAAIVSSLLPGRVLDELEVLAHSEQTGTIVAQSTPTRILAIPVDAFDDLLDRDADFARNVLELESRRLQQIVRSSASGG